MKSFLIGFSVFTLLFENFLSSKAKMKALICIFFIFVLILPTTGEAQWIQSHEKLTELAQQVLINENDNGANQKYLDFLALRSAKGNTYLDILKEGVRDADLRANGLFHYNKQCRLEPYDTKNCSEDLKFLDMSDWPIGDHKYDPTTLQDGEANGGKSYEIAVDGFWDSFETEAIANISNPTSPTSLFLDEYFNFPIPTEDSPIFILNDILLPQVKNTLLKANAYKMSSEFYTRAMNAWQEKRYTDAAYNLGITLHLVQDMSVPAHVYLDKNSDLAGTDVFFEDPVWNDWLDDSPAHPLPDLVGSYPAPTQDTAVEWIDLIARQMNTYLSVEGITQKAQLEGKLDQTISKSIQLAVEGSVGLITTFLEHVSQMPECSTLPVERALIRISETGDVTWLQNNVAYPVLAEDVTKMATEAGWLQVCEYSEAEITSQDYTFGPTLFGTSTDVVLIKPRGETKVYRVINGQKQWIVNETTFHELGFDFANVIEVSKEISDLFLQGDDILNANLTIEELNELFPFDWDIIDRESIYSLIQNSLNDPAFTYTIFNPWPKKVISSETNQWIRSHVSYTNSPVGTIGGQLLITPWLDASWGDVLQSNNSFNTVYAGAPSTGDKFEVISFIDEFAPFSGTTNDKSYLFTYDTKNDAQGNAVSIDAWVNYLRDVAGHYGRPIDTLTIFAHGSSGNIRMSDSFSLSDNQATQAAMLRLRSENIIASDATILLFSCEVGQGTAGQAFVQHLADWSGAIVYANSQNTGSYIERKNIVGQDWDLDVVRAPTPPEFVNHLPVAATRDAFDAIQQTQVTLDGSKSFVPDGQSSYLWTQISGTSVTINGQNTANTTFTAPAVSEATTLEFQLEVMGSANNSSSVTTTVTVLPEPLYPSIPTGLSVSYLSQTGENYLSWYTSTNAESYQLYWGTSPGVTLQSNPLPITNSLEFGHSGVQEGSCYYYRILALNGTKESGLSREVKSCIPATGISGLPIGIMAEYQSESNRNYVTWSSVTSATGYKVYWGTESGVTKNSEEMPETVTTDYGHTGVISEACYYYRVAAVNPAGESALSEEVSSCVPFSESSASVSVVLNPQEAVDGGVQWRVDGGTWQSSEATVENVSAGLHTIELLSVDGWLTPPSQLVEILPSSPMSFVATYTPSGTTSVELPKTGQTISYATGDDGDLQAGFDWPEPRFTDFGDGTVSDNLTGLIWTKNASNTFLGYCTGGTKNWQGALQYVACLNSNAHLGYTDWILPNRNELKSLLDSANGYPPLPVGHPFMAVGSGYWSSSTFAYDINYAWYLSMYYGYDSTSYKSTGFSVWPIRRAKWSPSTLTLSQTGQTVSYASGDDGDLKRGTVWPTPRFRDNGNGTVSDNLTGLVWLKNANCFGAQTWDNGLAGANTLASGSCGLTDSSAIGDWRLPNREELVSLTDMARYSPAITEGHPFSSVQLDYYWSSSSNVSTDRAWNTNMAFGSSTGTGIQSSKSNSYYIWPVRDNQSAVVDPLLTLILNGAGSGTVTPDIGDFSWNGTDGSASYALGSSVTLTVTADSGSTFAEWGGACSGSELTCTLAMDAALSVTATFDAINTGFGKITQGVTVSPTTVTLDQEFTVDFTLTETLGAPITYEQIVVAILKSDGTLLFDIPQSFNNITLPANGTWTGGVTGNIFTSNPVGQYQAVVRGRVSGGDWFDFEVIGLSVNPLTFNVYVVDFDGDGIQDNADAFPTDPAASVDTDGDEYPDRWNDGYTQADSTTGLELDRYPFNPLRVQRSTVLSAGLYHSTYIDLNYTLWAWGNNYRGQLGDGTTWGRLEPVLIGNPGEWLEVAAGDQHTVAIKMDGTLWAWGLNAFGQIGDGTTINRSMPTQIGTSANWVRVFAGEFFSLAINADGNLYAWGYNAYSQLGDNTTINQLVPKLIDDGNNWSSVLLSCGRERTYAVKQDGALWGWGYNLGQIPTQVGAENNWAQIAAGWWGHFLAIKLDGSLWAWGLNSSGQLGDGTTTYRSSPVQIGNDLDWESITAGWYHSKAIKTDNSLWAWGSNLNGEIGDGTNNNRLSPLEITSLVAWSQISAGGNHSIAQKLDGSLWAWGQNSSGQLGDGTYDNRLTPTMILDDDIDGVTNSLDAFPLDPAASQDTDSDGFPDGWNDGYNQSDSTSGLTLDFFPSDPAASQDADGDGFPDGWNDGYSQSDSTSGLTLDLFPADPAASQDSDGDGYPDSWNDGFSQSDSTTGLVLDALPQYFTEWADSDGDGIGDNTDDFPLIPLDRTVRPKIGGGYYYSAYVRDDGTLWSWGKNNYGQLGDGTLLAHYVPELVGVDTDWDHLSVGASHVLAIKEDGTLWAWGNNQSGQLGDGSTTNRLVPVQIGSDSDWLQISAGGSHSLGIKTDGTLWAWGNNGSGRLGDGTTVSRNLPTQIGSDTAWDLVSAGSAQSLALKADGTLWSWGDNSFGELGDGTTVGHLTPEKDETDSRWLKIHSDFRYSAGIKANGSLWAWGDNLYGQLGIGTSGFYANELSPVRVGDESSWTQVSAQFDHTLAIKSDGTLWAWGQNNDGQLGDGTNVKKLSPVQVGVDQDWSFVETGLSHSLALKSQDSLWSWGSGGWGVLGDGTSTGRLVPGQVFVEGVGSVFVGINPQGAIDNGALWRIDNGPWQESGVTLDGLSVGTHEIEFSIIPSWNQPSKHRALISGNTTTSVQVTYTASDALSKVATSGQAWSVDVSGQYAYVVAGGASSSAVLQVIDISTPQNPFIVGTLQLPGWGGAGVVSGSYVYVANEFAGLQVVDVSDPQNPAIVGSVDIPTQAFNLSVVDQYAYVADDTGLQIINITDPLQPNIVGSIATPDSGDIYWPNNALDVAVSGQFAYLTVYGNDDGLQVVDVSNPSNPIQIGWIDLPQVGGLYVEGSYVYVAVGNNGLRVIDISRPQSPTIVGTIDTPGDANNVTVSGSYAYVVEGSAYQAIPGGVQIIDISNPSNPTLTSSIETTSSANDIFVSDELLYVAEGNLNNPDEFSGLELFANSASGDQDSDGVLDTEDNCPSVVNTDQNDANGDGIGDACDTSSDTDNDGLSDAQEYALGTDLINSDSDGDNIDDGMDNCLLTANRQQTDANNNDIGDACDNSDTDSDGLTDAQEYALDTDPTNPDTDGDGVLDGNEVNCASNPLDPESQCNPGMPWLLLLLEDE
ncbi:DUF1566 domain-containing protein [Thermodesulfobacteriota bacterium]